MDIRTAIQYRRSYYSIEKKCTISDDKIVELVEFAALNTPSAFNSQSPTTAVLLGKQHDCLWDIVMESLRKIVPATQFANTEAKINGFKAGYGTVLFFDDGDITSGLQQKFPLYASNFPVWAEHANGMLQFVVWSLLESEGLGASLQHYNPLIDDEVHKAFDIPKGWRLIAQMPFGSPVAEPDEKEFVAIATRVKVYGSEANGTKNKAESDPEVDEEIACSAEFSEGCK